MPRDTYDTHFLERVKDHPGRPADTARLIRLWRNFPEQWAGADPDGKACARLENLHAHATGLLKAEAELRGLDAGPLALWANMTRPEFIKSVMERAANVFKSPKELTWMECAEVMAGPDEQIQVVRHVVAVVKRLEAAVRKETRGDNRAGEKAPALLTPDAAAAPDESLSAKEAIRQYHVSRATLARQRKAGKLKGHRPPGSPCNAALYYTRAELDNNFQRRKHALT